MNDLKMESMGIKVEVSIGDSELNFPLLRNAKKHFKVSYLGALLMIFVNMLKNYSGSGES